MKSQATPLKSHAAYWPLLFAVLLTACTSAPRIIDTHIHLYDTRRDGGVPWPPPTDDVLFRPTLTQHFDAVCQANGVSGTVIVEASDLVEDNQWVLDLVKHNPDRYIGLVGNLPVGTDKFAGLLDRFAKDKRFVGIRLRSFPKGVDGFTDAVWRDLNLLAEKGLTLDVLLANYDLDDIVRIAKRTPNLKILINHCTGLIINGTPADAAWAMKVRAAAAFPNVYCKISGIFQRSGRLPAPKDVSWYAPIFEVIWKAFGEDRLIYGSNWPVTDRGGEYGEQLEIIKKYFSAKGTGVTEKLFWKNAASFYGVKIR